MKLYFTICCLAFLTTVSSTVLAEELKDPRTRDEDLSLTQIEVQTNLLSNGFYEYVYIIRSPAENKGTIIEFALDMQCDLDFGPIEFPEPQDTFFRNYFGIDSGYVPIRPYNESDYKGPISGSIDKKIAFGFVLFPGETADRLRILSPAPPGSREFELRPRMDTEGWDYATYDGDFSVYIPWIGDFTVTGMVEGPACALKPPEEPSTYLGNGGEAENINALLSYSQPLRDRWHVDADVSEVEIKIHYSEDIDPKTFKVQPGWVRPHFNPEPGGTDTVVLPLKQAINKFHFEVTTAKSKGPRKENKLHHSLHDRDAFEIRRDVSKPNAASKKKGK